MGHTRWSCGRSHSAAPPSPSRSFSLLLAGTEAGTSNGPAGRARNAVGLKGGRRSGAAPRPPVERGRGTLQGCVPVRRHRPALCGEGCRARSCAGDAVRGAGNGLVHGCQRSCPGGNPSWCASTHAALPLPSPPFLTGPCGWQRSCSPWWTTRGGRTRALCARRSSACGWSSTPSCMWFVTGPRSRRRPELLVAPVRAAGCRASGPAVLHRRGLTLVVPCALWTGRVYEAKGILSAVSTWMEALDRSCQDPGARRNSRGVNAALGLLPKVLTGILRCRKLLGVSRQFDTHHIADQWD